ncbi:hypothetical protein ACPCTO_36035 [Streptomyces olivoreticuli]
MTVFMMPGSVAPSCMSTSVTSTISVALAALATSEIPSGKRGRGKYSG